VYSLDLMGAAKRHSQHGLGSEWRKYNLPASKARPVSLSLI